MAPSVEVFSMATHNDHLMLEQLSHHHDIISGSGSSHSDSGFVNPASPSSGNGTPALASRDGNNSNTSEDDNGQEVTRPGEHDVLLGRGGGTNNHSGNIKFRKLVNEHKMRYLACSKVDKPKVAREVVAIWRKLTPPGRFLARKDETKRGPGSVKASDNVWVEVGDKKAREKASQCLRERTPEVMPYIKHLREQQDAITEHGVSMVQQHMQLQQEGGGANPRHPHMSPQQVHQGFVQQQFSPAANRSPMVAQQAFPGRRTSMPVPPDPNMMGQMASPHQFQSMGMYQSPNARRASGFNNGFNGNQNMSGLPMAPVQDFIGGDGHGDMYANGGDYQQNMMMMQQQQHQQQQMQEQAQLRQMQQQQQQQQQQRMHQQQLGMSPVQHNGYHHQPQASYCNDDSEPFPVQSDPLMSMHDSPKTEKRSSAMPKRSREAPAERNVPDRAISDMSFTPDEEGGEVTIETYRKQLEIYLKNIENKDGKDPAAPSAAFGDAEYASDLEDDWEKEHKKNLQQNDTSNKRGVDRNVSGFSLMSAKTTKSNLSMISGISASMFSDISDGVDPRESKMNAARSVCSNISLMSELTDLSENLDNLGLDDE